MTDSLHRPSELSWHQLLELVASGSDRSPDQASVEAKLNDDSARDGGRGWAELAARVRELAEVALLTLGLRQQLEPDDLAQDALLLLLRPGRLDRLRDVDEPAAFVMVMLRNLAIDRLRQREAHSRIEATLESDTESTSSSSLEDSEATLIALDVFRMLSPDELLLVRLRFWEDRSLQEIADYLGLTYAAVAQRLSKLIRRLHNDLAR